MPFLAPCACYCVNMMPSSGTLLGWVLSLEPWAAAAYLGLSRENSPQGSVTRLLFAQKEHKWGNSGLGPSQLRMQPGMLCMCRLGIAWHGSALC